MKTNGNECVDIKEGASGNLIEHNECSNQLDDQSGCYDSRGDDNTFRFAKQNFYYSQEACAPRNIIVI